MSRHFAKHFTLDEAQAMIPWVRRIFANMHVALRRPGARRAGAPLPATEGPAPSMGAMITALGTEQRQELVHGLLKGMIQKGVVVQDVQRGLIDFPALRGGDEILLCYELSDGERIQFWHDLESGFAGRRPIEDLLEADR